MYILNLKQNFIRTDRLGICQLHLEKLFNQSPVLASIGHHN